MLLLYIHIICTDSITIIYTYYMLLLYIHIICTDSITIIYTYYMY